MGPMTRRPKLSRRKVARLSAAALAGLFLWSFVAAPSSTGVEEEVVEPAGLSAYSTLADARPVQTWFDHQVYQIPLGPSLAHSITEVSLPSTGSGIAWLVDGGLANGLHGTTTGSRVPTEASAKQPGGAASQEFVVAGGPIGSDPFIRAGSGVARAEAEHSDSPRAFANAYFGNLVVLPAAGSPEHPPGTFNPDATFPGGERSEPVPDPAPQGQMALLSIGSVASTAESFRSGETVTSIAVSEINDINIGNRTADNRCTNCTRIDFIRAEALAEASGAPGGSRGRYRVTLGRVCQRALDTTVNPPREVDRCLPLTSEGNLPEIGDDPPSQQTVQRISQAGRQGVQRIERFDQLNALFEKPLWFAPPPLRDTVIGIRIHAGTPHSDPDRARRTSDPPEETQRNFGYPDDRLNRRCASDPDCARKFEGKPVTPRHQEAPDLDRGAQAKAVAEGLDIDLWTVTTSQFVPDDRQIDEATLGLARQIDEDAATPGIQITVPNPACTPVTGEDQPCLPPVGTIVAGQPVQAWPLGQVTVGVEAIRTIRRVNPTLGVAVASATARPAVFVEAGAAPEAPLAPTIPEIEIPAVQVPQITIPEAPPGEPGTVVVTGGPTGPFRIKVHWSSFRLKPWPAGDLAKGLLSGGIIGGVVWLGRRRLRMLV